MSAESRDIAMYPPPRIWQRPFSFDYRRPPPTDAAGRLLFDIDGRPLDARFVAGRRFAGQPDTPLSPGETRDALRGLDIQLAEMPTVPTDERGAVGLYRGYEDDTGMPSGELFLKSTLGPADKNMTLAHEFGHALDHYSGILSDQLAQDEIDELRKIYPTLRAGGPRKSGRPQPEDFGYEPDSVNRELVAEGFRAYLTNPNYFKTLAPRTAARFRAAVNDSPYLRHIIQLNSLAAAALFGAGAAGGDQNGQSGGDQPKP
jgi:hypothetical protein